LAFIIAFILASTSSLVITISPLPKTLRPLIVLMFVPLISLDCFVSKAVCVAVDIGLFVSDVLSTLFKPTSDLVKVITPVFPATESTAPLVI
jgi:hypothetical protein